MNIKLNIVDDYDYIISEKGNGYMALRKIQWIEDGPVKIDLRKYVTTADGTEVMQKGKGLSFDDEAANELTRVLCTTGYGDTKEILEGIKSRDDFNSTLKQVMTGEDIDIQIDDGEEYYDIRNELA